MSLRRQVVLAGAVIVVIFGCMILALSYYMLLEKVGRVEITHARQDLLRVRNAIQNELSSLDATARDYASWDLTYEFIAHPTSRYAKTELTDSTLRTIRVNAFVLMDASTRVIATKILDSEGSRSIQAEDLQAIRKQASTLLGQMTTDSGISGVFRTSTGVSLFALRPILTSEHRGPSRGTLLMTRELDDELLRHISTVIDLPLTLPHGSLSHTGPKLDRNGVNVTGGPHDSLVGHVAIIGTDGEIATVLRADIPEVIRPSLRSAQSYLLAALCGLSLMCGFVTLMWLERVVLHPIGALSETIKHVTDKDDLSQRAPIFGRGRNELALLMTRVNLMLDRLQRSREELVQTRSALEHQATHDGLTGALNQLAIRQHAERESARAARDRNWLALLMIDLDHFKQVNDTYGHDAGDAVLKAVVREISSVLRPYDSMGRYGGEEFLVVAPQCRPDDARSIAQRITDRVAHASVPFGNHSIKVTVSVGVAASVGVQANELCRLADSALYEAKRNGRNQIVLAETSVPALAETPSQVTVN